MRVWEGYNESSGGLRSEFGRVMIRVWEGNDEN